MHLTALRLREQYHRTVDGFRAKGLHRVWGFNRADIMATRDLQNPELVIMQVLGVPRTTISWTRDAYPEVARDLAQHECCGEP